MDVGVGVEEERHVAGTFEQRLEEVEVGVGVKMKERETRELVQEEERREVGIVIR